MKIKKPQTDKPEEGKIYALTGTTDSKCILNGYSWKESEVKEEKKDEKIHNRGKPRVRATATDHRAGAQDHEQWMGKIWPPNRNQWPQASSSKPDGAKPQAPSNKLQAPQYGQIHLI